MHAVVRRAVSITRGSRWWLLASFVVVLDQTAKLLVQTLMPHGQTIPVSNFFSLVHVWNMGAAFSLLADAGGWQRYALLVFALAVSVWLAVELCKPLGRVVATAYALILGGALGNAVDRITRGYVVDYFDVYWERWHWPAFNLADVGITCGTALLATTLLRGSKASHNA